MAPYRGYISYSLHCNILDKRAGKLGEIDSQERHQDLPAQFESTHKQDHAPGAQGVKRVFNVTRSRLASAFSP